MKKLLRFSSAVLLLPFLFRFSAEATPIDNARVSYFRKPEVTLSGKVTTSKGEPLTGVSVVVKNTTIGVTTDVNGGFQLKTPAETGTLLISYIGFLSREVSFNGAQTNLQITLTEDTKALEEVVVVGYGTQERKNLISSVAKVNPEETKQIPVGSFDAQLQGKAPGVQISSNTGVPGEGIFIRIRGNTSINASNEPLYIVDGVFLNNTSLQTVNTGGKSTSPIADINPADIESIEVLKDASATAIYGSRAANGVVIVTTKRGAYNTKPRVNLNAYQGWAWTPKVWDIASGPENAALHNEAWINSGLDNPALKQTYENRPFRPGSEGGRGLPEEQQTYDRLSDIFRTASLKNYDLSVQGGTESTKFFLGGGYTKQESIMKPVYFERASIRLNLDQKITDKIQIGSSSNLSRSFRNQARAGDGPQGGMFQTALLVATYLPKVNEDGTPAKWGPWDNLDVLLNNYDVTTTSIRYLGNLYLDAELLPGLKFRTSWGLDYNNYDESEYWNTLTLLGASPTNGLATSAITQKTTWVNEQTLQYRTAFGGDHSLGVLVGNSIQGDVTSGTSAQGTNFANNSFTLISSAATRIGSESWTKSSLASFFSRIDYNYAGKYLLEASVRADGSSKFASGNQWGTFYSVGAAWRLKEEAFLKDVEFLSDLKLRASYGTTGNQNGISNFASRGLWNGGSSYPDNTPSGDRPGTAPQQLANNDLSWEKTKQWNAGLDVSFFKGRVGLELNYYRKYTTDLLLQLPLPGTTGFNTYYQNAGEVSNTGFEIGINTVNLQTNDFQWSTSFNLSGNKNKIEKLASPINVYSRDWLRMQQGNSLYTFWLYKQLYVDPQTGNAIFEDVNQDGQITVADRQLMGNAMPDFYGGLTSNFSYKGFDAGLLFTFQYGNEVYNMNEFFDMAGGTRADRVLFANSTKRWQKPGDITDVPRFTTVGNNYRLEQNSRLLEDGSFLRLKSFTVGYTLPKAITSKLRTQKLRVYAVGTNLWLLTNYSGLDPETNVTNDQNVKGLDFGTPPQPRSVQFGVDIIL
ncbi:SusC/RagA family TonB-linked outer membrane protein [Sabulibacter ruber]|uniref:SusC/RagA family TonB-linked outer membrane protein n=1 Tax=Sabulibacter ruber TaxID=2811901 RepID=UPI001A9593FF|nr:TonB-dependent receptor [Sabulibacter ruber]